MTEYKKSATTQTKIVDLFLAFILMTGALQFLYCAIVGTFPFNSFLSGFLSCVGMFALTGTFLIFPTREGRVGRREGCGARGGECGVSWVAGVGCSYFSVYWLQKSCLSLFELMGKARTLGERQSG